MHTPPASIPKPPPQWKTPQPLWLESTWLLASSVGFGYWLQTRLYQQAALSLPSYSVLAVVAFLTFAALVI